MPIQDGRAISRNEAQTRRDRGPSAALSADTQPRQWSAVSAIPVTMRAVRFHQHGNADVLRLEQVPTPVPGSREVLVRVHACSVMRTLDCEVRAKAGAFGPIPMPHILGADPAGDVVAVGRDVTGIAPGDRVVCIPARWCGVCGPCTKGLTNACLRLQINGVHTQGGYAEYVVLPVANLVGIPECLSYVGATAMMTMHPTAWHLLIDRGRLKPGETVLILGAGGALGTAGIAVAKLAGARVIAAGGADWKLDRARELGADAVVNYTTHSLAEEVKRLTDGAGADVVFENLATPELWPQSLASAAVLGRIVTCGALGGGSVETNMRSFYSKHLELLGSRAAPKAQIEHVYRLAGAGLLKPVVYRTLPLDQAAEAHALVESRDVFGRVVLTVGN